MPHDIDAVSRRADTLYDERNFTDAYALLDAFPNSVHTLWRKAVPSHHSAHVSSLSPGMLSSTTGNVRSLSCRHLTTTLTSIHALLIFSLHALASLLPRLDCHLCTWPTECLRYRRPFVSRTLRQHTCLTWHLLTPQHTCLP